MSMSNLKNALLGTLASISISLLLVACGGGVAGDANNFIAIDDQALVDLDEVSIASASVDRTVCIVISDASVLFDDQKGDTVLGEKTLEPGDYSDIIVSLSRESQDNESLFAELREGYCAGDNGSIKTSDNVVAQGSVSAVQFFVAHPVTPFIVAKDQAVNIRNEIIVKKIVTDVSSWVVLHRFDNDAENQLGDIVDFQPGVQEGNHDNVKIVLARPLALEAQFIVALYLNVEERALEDDVFDRENDTLITSALSSVITVSPAQ